MINELTQQQKDSLPRHRDEWLKIGLSTETNRIEAEKAIDEVCRCAGLDPPRIKIWLRSPHEGSIGAHLLLNLKSFSGDQVRDQVWAQVWAQVRDQVWAQVRSQVGDQVRDQVGAQVRDQISKAGYGCHDAAWLSYYAFFLVECSLKIEKILGLINLAKFAGWYWPFESAVIFTPKPIEVHLRDKRLHKDLGPAILYEDGFAVWALHGVRVPKEIAETPANKLDGKLILSEKNAEIRREIVRKIGIHRVMESLGAVVMDKWEEYELVNINLGDNRTRPYLKMLNPSIGTWHIEGVHPDCNTVQKALAWRNGTDKFIQPEVLT